MLAAAWLLRATGQPRYATDALEHWRAPAWKELSVGWDAMHAPAVNVLLGLAAVGAEVPGAEEYEAWYAGTFQPAWLQAQGKCMEGGRRRCGCTGRIGGACSAAARACGAWCGGSCTTTPPADADGAAGPVASCPRTPACIPPLPSPPAEQYSFMRTPGGLVCPSWSSWGRLSYACGGALMACVRERYCPADRAACRRFARQQLAYCLGSTGRSFVVGLGRDPPTRPHHRAASCPPPPAACGWDCLHAPGPNPHVLRGALVGGPPAGDGSHRDDRQDYQGNEVALTYNAAYTSALAALLCVA